MVHAKREPATTGQVVVRTIEAGAISTETGRLDERELRAGGDARVTWIDLVDPSEATLRSLQDIYRLHPLIARKVTEWHRTSEATSFDHTTHIVLRYPHAHGSEIEAREIQLLVGETFFISIHRPQAFDLDDTLDTWRAMPETWRTTTGSLLYATIRTVIAAYGPIVDDLDARLERLERDALTPPHLHIPSRELLYELFQLSERITDVSNFASPAQEMLQSLAQKDTWPVQTKGHPYARDVVDDASQIANRLGMLNDAAQRLFDMVNSLITLRSTDVSNRLTIVATIFLPLSFLTSYFGQNFAYMTDSVSGGGQFLIWGIMVPFASLVISLLLLRKVGSFG